MCCCVCVCVFVFSSVFYSYMERFSADVLCLCFFSKKEMSFFAFFLLLRLPWKWKCCGWLVRYGCRQTRGWAKGLCFVLQFGICFVWKWNSLFFIVFVPLFIIILIIILMYIIIIYNMFVFFILFNLIYIFYYYIYKYLYICTHH